MLNIFVSKVCLEGTRIRVIVCQLEAARMPEHVGMDFDFELGLEFSMTGVLPKTDFTRMDWAYDAAQHHCGTEFFSAGTNP